MTKKYSTKKALIASVLSLALCFSMLVGTTFAWFTDSVTSANNIIMSGNLDVELEYSTDMENWTAVNANTNIFKEDTLWEPGHTEVVYLRVSNVGSLAMKYKLGVSVAGETVGKTRDNDTPFKLSDYILYGVAKDVTAEYADRTAARAAITTATKLNVNYSEEFHLVGKTATATDTDVFALVVYMPETVGNEANHNGTDIPVINLGLSVLATQDTVESDSFNDQYDVDAHYAIAVKDAAGLISAIKTVEDGGLIVLDADVTFDANTATKNGDWYEGIYYTGDKSFTIDLGGKTITNDSAVNDYLMLFKNDGDKANTITLRNGTIEAGSSAYCAICTSTASTQKITINLENVNVIGNNSNGSVVKIRSGAELNVKSGTVIKGTDSYLGIENSAATVNINDGVEIYQNGTTSYNGCLVGVGGNGVVNVYGGYGKGVAGGFIAMTSGGTINVYGGEWIADTDGSFSGNDNVLIAQNDKVTYAGAGNSVVNVYGGTFNGTYNCYGNVAGDAQINIFAGKFNADPSAYVADGYTAIDNGNGTYTVGVATAEGLTTAIANGGTVTLVDDITMPAGNLTVAADTKAVIDLGGNDLTVTNTDATPAFLMVEGDLTITGEGNVAVRQINASEGSNLTLGEGVTISTSNAYAINNSGTTVLDGATIKHTGTNHAIQNDGTLIINDATVTSTSTKNISTINSIGGTVTINGGTFTHNGSMGSVICDPYGNSEIIIYGGTFVQNGSDSLVNMNFFGILTINGGTFDATSMFCNMEGNNITINAGVFKNNAKITDYGFGSISSMIPSTSTATTNADGSITVTKN